MQYGNRIINVNVVTVRTILHQELIVQHVQVAVNVKLVEIVHIIIVNAVFMMRATDIQDVDVHVVMMSQIQNR